MEKNSLVEILAEILLQDRGSIKRVADAANCSYRAVHDACHNKSRNPSNEILKAAFVVTLDPRLKEIIEPAGYTLVHKGDTLPHSQNLEREVGDVVVQVSKLIPEARMVADSGLDKETKIKIQKRIERVKAELSEVEHLIETL